MIFPIVLHHNSSTEYTVQLIGKIMPRSGHIVDSSKLGTHFTESFNVALETFMQSKFSHVMICNNDIDLDYDRLIQLENVVKGKKGIFSPVVNSPHTAVMHKQGDAVQRKVPWVEFVCPIISKDVVKEIGLLDTKMPRGWGIELDYCYRAKQAGFNTNLIQTVSVHHYGHKSQVDHEEYSHYANIEMNDRLREKYGDKWQEVLKYPQW
jgi:GT2 family glycosyltransferase